jgi:hypothetical protein
MRCRVVVSLVGAFLGVCVVGDAFAEPHHATLCNPIQGNRDFIDYSHWGVRNTLDNAQVTVHCGGAVVTAPFEVSAISVSTYDRNTLPNQDICCTMRVTDNVGNIQSSAVRCTSGFGSAPMPPLNATLLNLSSGVDVDIECTIPPMDQGQISWISSYDIE